MDVAKKAFVFFRSLSEHVTIDVEDLCEFEVQDYETLTEQQRQEEIVNINYSRKIIQCQVLALADTEEAIEQLRKNRRFPITKRYSIEAPPEAKKKETPKPTWKTYKAGKKSTQNKIETSKKIREDNILDCHIDQQNQKKNDVPPENEVEIQQLKNELV